MREANRPAESKDPYSRNSRVRGLHSLTKKSVLSLFLGGAAVYRCDKCLALGVGFGR